MDADDRQGPPPAPQRLDAPANEPAARRSEPGLVIARLGGIPIVLAPSWFIFAIVVTVLFAPIAENQLPGLGPWAFVLGAVFTVLLYASVLVHELGHSVMARRYGVPVRRIQLQLLGGVSELERELDTPRRSFIVSVVGPLLSLALGAFGWLALWLLDPSGAVRLILVQVTAANLLVGVFNLLPGYPLDGGHLVRAVVWRITGSPSQGTRVAAWCGRGVAVIAFVLPFGWAAASGVSPSIVSVIWAALIAAFIWSGASQALAIANRQQRVPLVTARALVRRAVPVLSGTPLAAALQQLADSGARAIVVMDRADRPLAIVSEASVAAVPIERRPWIDVGAVSRRITPDMFIPVDAAADDLLQRLDRARSSEALVVDDGGLVVGVLTMTDVHAALTGRAPSAPLSRPEGP